MVKTVVTFSPKRVIKAGDAPYRTERFVSRQRVFERVAELIDRAAFTKERRRVARGLSKSSREAMAKLASELDDPDPALRILRAVEWYEQHCTDKYVPWIEGGRTLYEKFGRLEAQMFDRGDRETAVPTSVDEVVAGLFNGSKVLADSFRSDVLARASSLDLGGASESSVAARLGDAYRAIRAARNGVSPEGILGPLGLLERYVGWLGEKDWQMTIRVLGIDSPAFQQFRRELASRHPHGADPVTGKRSGE
jgi:hypothetical protein